MILPHSGDIYGLHLPKVEMTFQQSAFLDVILIKAANSLIIRAFELIPRAPVAGKNAPK